MRDTASESNHIHRDLTTRLTFISCLAHKINLLIWFKIIIWCWLNYFIIQFRRRDVRSFRSLFQFPTFCHLFQFLLFINEIQIYVVFKRALKLWLHFLFPYESCSLNLVSLRYAMAGGRSSVDLCVVIVVFLQGLVDMLLVRFHIWVYHVYVLCKLVDGLPLFGGFLFILPRVDLTILSSISLVLGQFILSDGPPHLVGILNLIGVVVGKVRQRLGRLGGGHVLLLLSQKGDSLVEWFGSFAPAVVVLI